MSGMDGMKYGAGLTPEARLARLEQIVIAKSIGTGLGDMIGFDADGLPVRLPAAPGNGYVRTSDTSQTGGAFWSLRGKSAGYEEATSNKDATLNNGVTSSGLFTGFSVTGDNIHYLWLEFWCEDFRCTNGTGNMSLVLRYGSTGIGQSDEYAASASNRATGAQIIRVRMAPFSGSRTFNIHSYNGDIGAGAVLRVVASATSPAFLSATWGEKA